MTLLSPASTQNPVASSLGRGTTFRAMDYSNAVLGSTFWGWFVVGPKVVGTANFPLKMMAP